MTEISRAALFGKLNRLAYKAMEGATVFCKMRGNPHVEMAHWFHQILQLPDSDLISIVKEFEINPSKLIATRPTGTANQLCPAVPVRSQISLHISRTLSSAPGSTRPSCSTTPRCVPGT